ncbi:MAG: hypothetical protein KAT05_17100 [Spirochaetes bacterium]|nr:hypothetical protein [Spirochaetota bacterium]
MKKCEILIVFDNILGLRSLGLILYGTLPSYLTLLGVLDLKIIEINEILPYILPISTLPIFLTYLLIRERHRNWYLATDWLNIRSAITTIIILFLATLISEFSGIIHNRYVFTTIKIWELNDWTAIGESFLLAVVSLVFVNTFFITALTKEINLPGLPSSQFTEHIKNVRINMREMQKNQIWVQYINLSDNELINLAEKTEKDLNLAIYYSENYFAKKSLEIIHKDINNLIYVLNDIKKGSNRVSKLLKWKRYFGNEQKLSKSDRKRRQASNEKIVSIKNLEGLKLGV